MTIGNYAMIETGKTYVINTVVKDDDFELDGYYFVKIKEGVFCQQGMYYNNADGLFYGDPDFTTLYPPQDEVETL